MRRALAQLLARMGEYPHGYEPTAQVFLALDRDRLVRELDPAGSG